jgi:hypothetical protein
MKMQYRFHRCKDIALETSFWKSQIVFQKSHLCEYATGESMRIKSIQMSQMLSFFKIWSNINLEGTGNELNLECAKYENQF